MKITIEPSGDQRNATSQEATYYRVQVEHPYDDLSLDLAIELCMNALKALGYSSTAIDQWLAGD